MTSKPADAFGKQVLFDTLVLAGARAAIEEEVQHAPQLIDVYVAEPPHRHTEIGLLGQMAGGACLLEAFSQAPSLEDVRSCQRKQLAVHQRNRLLHERELRPRTHDQHSPSSQRLHRSSIPPPPGPELPRLYILAAGRPRSVIHRFQLRRTAFCTPGFYFSSSVYALCLVVIDELVPDRSTLPLRLLGRGKTLQAALREAWSLPDEDPLKGPLLDAISNRHRSVKAHGHVPTPEDKEFHMRIDEEFRILRAQSLEEGRRIGAAEARAVGEAAGRAVGEAAGRAVGEAQGRCAQARRALLRLLQRRRLLPNEHELATIETCQDMALLESWHDRALDGDSVASILAATTD